MQRFSLFYLWFSAGIMTNEQYLYISYFGAAAGGIVLAALTAIILARPHRRITEAPAPIKLGKFLRRAFPSWLLLAVLLGFISVSYMECRTYAEVVADRYYLVDKTQQQVYRMSICLAVALMSYTAVLILFLWARARAQRHHNEMQNK